jgi:hypothetical protein
MDRTDVPKSTRHLAHRDVLLKVSSGPSFPAPGGSRAGSRVSQCQAARRDAVARTPIPCPKRADRARRVVIDHAGEGAIE